MNSLMETRSDYKKEIEGRGLTNSNRVFRYFSNAIQRCERELATGNCSGLYIIHAGCLPSKRDLADDNLELA